MVAHSSINHAGITGVGVTPAIASYKRTSASYTTTSTTFVDVDGTNMALAITTGARRVLVGFVGTVEQTVDGQLVDFDIDVDGTRVGGTNGLIRHRQYASNGGNTMAENASFTFLTDALTAASHTFKLQWKVSSGSGTIGGNSTSETCQFYVIEQGA